MIKEQQQQSEKQEAAKNRKPPLISHAAKAEEWGVGDGEERCVD